MVTSFTGTIKMSPEDKKKFIETLLTSPARYVVLYETPDGKPLSPEKLADLEKRCKEHLGDKFGGICMKGEEVKYLV